MPAKAHAEWKGDVPTGAGIFTAGDTISGGIPTGLASKTAPARTPSNFSAPPTPPASPRRWHTGSPKPARPPSRYVQMPRCGYVWSVKRQRLPRSISSLSARCRVSTRVRSLSTPKPERKNVRSASPWQAFTRSTSMQFWRRSQRSSEQLLDFLELEQQKPVLDEGQAP